MPEVHHELVWPFQGHDYLIFNYNKKQYNEIVGCCKNRARVYRLYSKPPHEAWNKPDKIILPD